MTEHLEQVIQQLLVPDNEVIKQATAEVKRLMKEPGVMQALCTLLANSQHGQVRQYSAVLLRKLILKHKQWAAVESGAANEIKANLLRIAIAEKDRAARRSMIQVVATVARHDIRNEKWPELLPSLEAGARSADPESREMAMAVLSAVAGESHSRLGKHMVAVLRLCGDMLGDESASKEVIHHTLTCLKNVVPSASTQTLKPWQQLVVKVMVAVRRLAPVDEDAAADAMEIFDELIETEVPILRPHVQTFVQFCLEMAGNQGSEGQRHGDKVVGKALSLVAAVIRQKKKVIVKLNLIAPILSVIFPVMCMYEEKAGEDEVDELEESHAPDALAAQVVDTMALHLPPERLISALLKHVTPALDSPTSAVRRAAFVALAVSSEGCGEHLKTKYLEKFLLPRVYAGLNDPSAEVRHTVLFALGQFSEHLQPNISKHSATLLPLLFECLRKTSDASTLRQKDITRTYYAVEMFCENLGKEIVPYLEDLLSFLLNAIESPTSSGEVKELAISAISSTAAAAKKDLAPYFPRIQASLEKFLYPTEDEAQQKIQLQALEALGILAQTLGEQFRPLTTGCMSLGLGLLERTDDPDLRRCIYSLFAAVSTILKHDMEQYLPAIVPVMVERVKSVEGMSTRLKDADQELMSLFADDEEEEDDEEDLEDDEEDDELDRVAGVDIQTPYLDEKEDACVALGTVAKSVGALFLPYLEETYKEVLLLLEYPVSDVRKASASALGDLCCTAGKVVRGWEQGGDGVKKQQLETGLSEMLHDVVPLFIAMVRSDEEREVCMTVLDSLNEMLKEIGAVVLTHAVDTSTRSKGAGDAAHDGPSAVMSVVREVIQRKTRCQMEEDVEELDEEDAEHDAMLIENAGDILPTLAGIVGGDAFAPYFAAIVPELSKKLRKSAATSDRSFAIGVFAETLEKMGSAASTFVGRLYQMFVAALEDSDEEVRNNAVYGLGVLAANGGVESVNKYGETLTLLTRIMASETDERVRDNVCGAVCRMITANPASVPLPEFLPTVLSRLPLQVDIEENATVYRCVGALYEAGSIPPATDGTVANLVAIAGRLLADGEVSPDTRAVLISFVALIGQREPAVVAAVVAGVEENVKDSLTACFPNGA